MGYARQPLSRLPFSLLGSESGALPSEDSGRNGGTGWQADFDFRAFHNDQLASFYEQIAELTGSHKILPMNSGAEAVESAIKAVRKWGYEVKGRAGWASRDHCLR